MAVDSSESLRKKNSCFCSKNDFLPEESFKNFGNYIQALKETPSRLVNRILARSLDSTEQEMKTMSQHEMKKTLNWWDLIWFGNGGVIGAGIFVLTGLEARDHAGPAIVLSYFISGISAMLSVFCYTEFAVEIPVAGGSFAYLRVELGDFIAFIAAGNILMEYVVGGAAISRSWTSYFATLCNHTPDSFRIHAQSLPEDYSHLDPIAVGIITLVCILAVTSTKGSSLFNYIASVVHIAVILFIIIAGLTKADSRNYSDFAPYGARGIFQASAVLFFAYIGFDNVATMAEETKNPSKDIPIGLIGSMLTITVAYCLLGLTLCLMQPYNTINADAPFSAVFEAAGMGWAKYVVAAGALKGMTTVMLVNAIGQARYLTHIARTHMMPPWLAVVNAKTGTPVNATVVMLIASGLIGFFTKLEILSNIISISTLFIFMLVAVALLVRRYYVSGVTTDYDRNKFITCLTGIIGSSIGTAAYWGASPNGWIGYCITVPIWVFSTVALRVYVPHARAPKVWGTPLVPWLPSLSIGMNIFLLGSIEVASFVRFAAWTGFLLVYYVLVSLHATYDSAKTTDAEKPRSLEASKVEEGAVIHPAQ